MASRGSYPSGSQATGPPSRPASGSWAKSKRAYSQGSQNSPNETPLPPSPSGNPATNGQTGNPSTYGQKGHPAQNTRIPPAQYANTRTPSQGSYAGNPSQYPNTRTPSQGSYAGTPSQYANTRPPPQGSSTRNPVQYANSGTPLQDSSQDSYTGTPSQYANTRIPSQDFIADSPSGYARNGTPPQDSSQDSYTGTPSQYDNNRTPSQYARNGTPPQDLSHDSYTGTPSQYANNRTPSQDSYDGTPSQYARTGTPSQDPKSPTVPSQEFNTSFPSQDSRTTIPIQDAKTTIPAAQDAKTTIPSQDTTIKIPPPEGKVTIPSEDDKAAIAALYAQPVAYKPSASSFKVRMATQPYSASSSVYGNYRSKQSISLGAFQITVGIMSIIFNIIGLFIQGELHKLLRFASSEFPYYVFRGENFMFHLGYGFWCAVFYIVAGCFAIAAGRSRTRCTIITSMVASILAALFSWAQIPMAAASIGIDGGIPRESFQQVYYPQDGIPKMRYSDEQWAHIQSSLAMACCLLGVGILEFIFALWSSILACRVTCGRKTSRAPVATVTANTGVVYAVDSAPGVPQYVPQHSGGQPSVAGVAATGPPALCYGRPDPNATASSISSTNSQGYNPNTAPSFGDCEVSTPHASAAYDGFNIM